MVNETVAGRNVIQVLGALLRYCTIRPLGRRSWVARLGKW